MNNYKIKVINPNSPYYGKEGTFLGVENGKVNVEIDGKIISMETICVSIINQQNENNNSKKKLLFG